MLSLLLALWLQLTPAICGDALAQVQQGERWQVLDSCVTVEATVEGSRWPSSNGAYWYLLRDGEGQVWGKFYPGISPMADLRDGDRVRLTGPLVADGAWYGWREVVPVVGLEIVERAEQQRGLLSLGHIEMPDGWLHVVTAYCQAPEGCAFTLRDGRQGWLGYHHGDVWNWLLDINIDSVNYFVSEDGT